MGETTENTPISKAAFTKRLEELERSIKAILTAIKHAEGAGGEECMPEGEYYGIKFGAWD